MKIEKFEYEDKNYDCDTEGFIITDEEEIIINFENTFIRSTKRYKNLRELVIDLTESKTMAHLADNLSQYLIDENEELEKILKIHFEK